LVVSVAMLAFAGLPQLRDAYVRHSRVVLRAYCVLLFLLLPAISEWHVRRVLGVQLCLSLAPGFLLVVFMTAHLSYIPMPLRDSLALLAARWVLMFTARILGEPIWPRPEPPLHLSSLLYTTLHVTCAVILVLSDRRSWAAWRSARRKRLAASHVAFKAAVA
jgi:hypothetical protein